MLLFSNSNSNTLYSNSNSVNILLNFEEGNLDSLRRMQYLKQMIFTLVFKTILTSYQFHECEHFTNIVFKFSQWIVLCSHLGLSEMNGLTDSCRTYAVCSGQRIPYTCPTNYVWTCAVYSSQRMPHVQQTVPELALYTVAREYHNKLCLNCMQ